MTATMTPRPVVSDIRLQVAAAITVVPTYGAPPDDVAHIPCAVVGPPSMTRLPAMGGLWDLSYEVIVIGRRYDSLEVHTQLDDLAWAVVGELETADITTASSKQLSVLTVIPGLIAVAGLDHPTHTITLVARAAYC